MTVPNHFFFKLSQHLAPSAARARLNPERVHLSPTATDAIFFPLLLNDTPFQALFDTGAYRSFFNSHLLHTIDWPLSPLSEEVLLGCDGATAMAVGLLAGIRLRCNKLDIAVDLACLELWEDTPVIIGRDLMRSMDRHYWVAHQLT